MEGTDSAETFKHMQEKISAALVQTTATAGRISQEDVSFQRSLDSNVSETLDRHSGRLLRLVQGLLDRAVDGLDVEAPRLKEQDDLENKWSGVVDVVDSLLERADTCLDVHTGRIKRLKLEETKQVCLLTIRLRVRANGSRLKQPHLYLQEVVSTSCCETPTYPSRSSCLLILRTMMEGVLFGRFSGASHMPWYLWMRVSSHTRTMMGSSSKLLSQVVS